MKFCNQGINGCYYVNLVEEFFENVNFEKKSASDFFTK